MKKWFAAIAAVVAVAGLAGCGNGDSDPEPITKTVVDNRSDSTGAKMSFTGGSGELVVGEDIATGTYRPASAASCIYLVRESKNGTVITGTSLSGGDSVSVSFDVPGTTVETSGGCGTWTLVSTS
ncbi:hypothetical protein [Gordonia malaquae]|uniref:hypothetical protein n=1 Tax=Gordonia malaquae TaxID=410332 RepID=UPI0030FEBDA8